MGEKNNPLSLSLLLFPQYILTLTTILLKDDTIYVERKLSTTCSSEQREERNYCLTAELKKTKNTLVGTLAVRDGERKKEIGHNYCSYTSSKRVRCF